MENIEELLRDAFRAGMNKGGHQSYFDAPLDETEYIDSIKDKLKLFFIPDVSQQRELLEDYQHFIDWNEEHDRKASTSERIESFIASNCG